jgi:hypothetical protein
MEASYSVSGSPALQIFKNLPASVVQFLQYILQNSTMSVSLVMRLKVLDAVNVLGICLIVGRRGERAVCSDASHPLINTAINLTPD